ncbi:MAG TPA: hypothetical protein VGO83_01050 [Thermoleophilaceae bacterium]|nr:hypothetical protein [Thermoleophilaceae bacterium]
MARLGNAAVTLVVAAAVLGAPAVAGAQSFDGLLHRSNRQAVRDWYPGWAAAAPGTGEVAVRTAASHAVALAVGGEDRVAAGVVDRLARTEAAWGGQWQSPYWAGELGLAALVLGNRAGRRTRARVRIAVRREAELLLAHDVNFFRRDGVILTPGDTKGEEDGWRGMLLSVAAALMPRDAHRSAWLRKNRAFVVAALARPQDTDGRYAVLLDGGSNVNADFTVTNHNVREHPDYAAALLGETGFQLLTAALSGRRAPCYALMNHRRIYERLTASYAPGGLIRRPFTDVLVQGRPPFAFALVDLQASILGYGGRPAARWQERHLAAALHPSEPWPAPYGEAWNRGVVASVAARGVLVERLAPALRRGLRQRCRAGSI